MTTPASNPGTSVERRVAIRLLRGAWEKGCMREETADQRLSLISTPWSLVCRAHQGSIGEAEAARKHLLERYGGAVSRYLGKVLRDPDAAAEVFQEFALQLVHGKLQGA